jgi:hypothetical protein
VIVLDIVFEGSVPFGAVTIQRGSAVVGLSLMSSA